MDQRRDEPVLGGPVWEEDSFYGEMCSRPRDIYPPKGGGSLGHLHLPYNPEYSEARRATGLIRERRIKA